MCNTQRCLTSHQPEVIHRHIMRCTNPCTFKSINNTLQNTYTQYSNICAWKCSLYYSVCFINLKSVWCTCTTEVQIIVISLLAYSSRLLSHSIIYTELLTLKKWKTVYLKIKSYQIKGGRTFHLWAESEKDFRHFKHHCNTDTQTHTHTV